jgi:DNA-binding NarL/FixJ family response regulator
MIKREGTRAQTSERDRAPRPVGRLRVMLVDDHALIRSAVRQAIEGPDVVVVEEADSQAEAIERGMRSQPDVVLVDIGLGGSGDGV